MARKASPARLVIALSVAGVLAVFLLYTSIAGGGNPSLAPSELAGRTGAVQLAGLVVGVALGREEWRTSQSPRNGDVAPHTSGDTDFRKAA